MKHLSRSSRDPGFTLVEVIVAVSVIVVGVMATVTVANIAVRASGDNERKVVATNLAREGVELVRNIRDSNWQTYVSQQKARGAGALSEPQRNLNDWDCYPGSEVEASNLPFTCRGHLAEDFTPARGPLHATAGFAPGSPSASPYLVAVTTNGTFAPDNTLNPGYLLCQRAGGSPNVYLPTFDPALCLASGKKYYRRITIESRTGNSGSESIFVRSSVSWEGLPREQEIVVETYFTDWRNLR